VVVAGLAGRKMRDFRRLKGWETALCFSHQCGKRSRRSRVPRLVDGLIHLGRKPSKQ